MKSLFLILACMTFLAAGTSFACSPPYFPPPEYINKLYQKQGADAESLTKGELAKLAEFKSDSERYMTVFNKRYPCKMLPPGHELTWEELSLEEEQQLEAEINALQKKWQDK